VSLSCCMLVVGVGRCFRNCRASKLRAVADPANEFLLPKRFLLHGGGTRPVALQLTRVLRDHGVIWLIARGGRLHLRVAVAGWLAC